MSSDKTERQSYSEIPAVLRDVYKALEDELIWIHERWVMYRQLFGTNETRIQLLNECSPSFFGNLQRLWMDYIVLDICRITDPPKSGANENLVIKQLSNRLDHKQYADLADRLGRLEHNVATATERLRILRNKRIAHSDFESVIGGEGSPILGISRQNVEEALHAIRTYVNAFRLHFVDDEMCFEGISLLDDATTLIYDLKRASEYRRLESQNHDYRDRIRFGQWKNA